MDMLCYALLFWVTFPHFVLLKERLFCKPWFISAGKPKKNNALKSLAVLLGPDFITDVIEVGISREMFFTDCYTTCSN